jgi:hypothetical protein
MTSYREILVGFAYAAQFDSTAPVPLKRLDRERKSLRLSADEVAAEHANALNALWHLANAGKIPPAVVKRAAAVLDVQPEAYLPLANLGFGCDTDHVWSH